MSQLWKPAASSRCLDNCLEQGGVSSFRISFCLRLEDEHVHTPLTPWPIINTFQSIYRNHSDFPLLQPQPQLHTAAAAAVVLEPDTPDIHPAAGHFLLFLPLEVLNLVPDTDFANSDSALAVADE